MKALVVGVLALASALVREREDALRDWTGRSQESQSILAPRAAEGEVQAQAQVDVGVGESARAAPADEVGADTVAGNVTTPPDVSSAVAGASDPEAPSDTSDGSTNGSTNGSTMVDVSSDARWPHGQWQIACEIKSGSALVFDRASLRDYGTVTLFRWSAPRTRVAGPGEQIFTALVNCREKTIEAAWPGRRRETYAGTCGRGLVEAVCAASEQAAASTGTPTKSRAAEPVGAGHAGAGVTRHR